MRRLIRCCVLLLVIGGLNGTLRAQKGKRVAKRPAQAKLQTKAKPRLPTFRGRPFIEAGRKPINNKALSLPEPEYPNNPQTARIKEAVIRVEIFISELGEVLAAKAVSGPRSLRAAAEQAARRAKFSGIPHAPVVVKGYLLYRFPPADENTKEKSFPTPEEFTKNKQPYQCIIENKQVVNDKAIRLPDAEYPLPAREAQAKGLVKVEIIIDTAGNVVAGKAISGHKLLHQSALNAARQAKFLSTNAHINCQMFVKAWLVYRFTLPQ